MEFLEFCTGHAGFRHPVFERLAARPLSTCGMRMFWFQMSPFCAATRTFGGLINTLAQLGHSAVVQMLREIEESERGHAFELDLCAVKLVSRTGQLPTSMVHYERLEPETEAAVEYFERRSFAKTANEVAYWLGATYAVEVMANRSIIPGEVIAFVESGFYDVVLHELPYLVEHAGEQGAEINHERLMEGALEEVVAAGLDRSEIERGIVETMNVISTFYDGLMRVSLHCPHSV